MVLCILRADQTEKGLSALTQIKLIASDLDHTLLTEAGTLPPHFYDEIRALHNQGIHFVAASGRAIYTLKPMFEPVKDCMSLVGENGAVVIRNGEIVYSQFLPKADYVRLIQHTRDLGLGVPLLCALDASYIDEKHVQYADNLRHFITELRVVPDITKLDVDVPKYTVYYPNGGLTDVYERDYVQPLGDQFHVTVGGSEFLDIMHRVVNKGHALSELGGMLDVTPDEMITFGDNLNDIEMLKLAGHSYIMQAATKAIEPYATARIGSNSDYAVANKIQNVLDQHGVLV